MSYLPYVFIPLFAAILAQLIKIAINAVKGTFSWHDLNSYGGMPSSHAALVVSLTALIGYFEGFDTAAFAIAFVLMILIIRDSGGFRRVLGRHAEAINQLAANLKSEASAAFSHQTERLGHTPLELFFVALLGIIVAVIYILLYTILYTAI